METIVRTRVPAQGVQTVTTSAKPLTQITKSSVNTTFTKTRATDGSAWDLSNAEVGYLAKIGDFRGIVSAVDDAGNYVDVQQWYYRGNSLQAQAERVPTAGDQVEIHKCDGCKEVILDADDGNSASIFVGFDENVTVSGATAGHPIASTATQPNHRLVLEIGVTPIIDLTSVYVIAASTQTLHWVAM